MEGNGNMQALWPGLRQHPLAQFCPSEETWTHKHLSLWGTASTFTRCEKCTYLTPTPEGPEKVSERVGVQCQRGQRCLVSTFQPEMSFQLTGTQSPPLDNEEVEMTSKGPSPRHLKSFCLLHLVEVAGSGGWGGSPILQILSTPSRVASSSIPGCGVPHSLPFPLGRHFGIAPAPASCRRQVCMFQMAKLGAVVSLRKKTIIHVSAAPPNSFVSLGHVQTWFSEVLRYLPSQPTGLR